MRLLNDGAVCSIVESWDNDGKDEYAPLLKITCLLCDYTTRWEEEIDGHLINQHNLMFVQGLGLIDSVIWEHRQRVLQ